MNTDTAKKEEEIKEMLAGGETVCLEIGFRKGWGKDMFKGCILPGKSPIHRCGYEG